MEKAPKSKKSMTPTTQNVMKFEELIEQLTDTIRRAKVQTGELTESKNQIAEIDRALRGFNGEGGLISRVERLHDKLNPLIEHQIPDMLKSIETAIKAAGAATIETQQIRLRQDAELARLRQEFEAHIKIEEKEESKFGGREWFRENGSGLLIAVITALTTAITLGLAERLLKAIP